MESSFEKLMRIGESIALVHADPGKRKAEEMEEPEERCLDQYFDGRAKGVGQEDLESHCVEIMNNPGLYCCLNQWFTNGSSKFEDPITLEEIDPNANPEKVAITYPGLHRWNLESLEEQIKRRGWKDQYNGPIDFYMIITSAKRTQIDSGTGLPSVTDNQDSRGTYTFEGTIKKRNGVTLEGQFENLHKENGRPVFDSKRCKLTSNIMIYQGEWKQGIWTRGTMRFPATGDVYQGNFRDGFKHGEGKTIYGDGSVHVGNYKNDTKHGKGKAIFSNGTYQIGEWRNGHLDGQVNVKFPNGNFYTGFVSYLPKFNRSGAMGQGTMKYATGDVYAGKWENGRKKGQGTMMYSNGDFYVGEWENDQKNGQGTMMKSNGDVYTGEWENGEYKED